MASWLRILEISSGFTLAASSFCHDSQFTYTWCDIRCIVDMLIWFYSDVHVRRSSGSFFSHFQLRNSEQLLSHWSASVMSAPDSTAPEFQDITSQTGNAEHKKWLNYKILRREETRRDALKPSEQNVSLFRCRSCCRGRGWRIPLLESSRWICHRDVQWFSFRWPASDSTVRLCKRSYSDGVVFH